MIFPRSGSPAVSPEREVITMAITIAELIPFVIMLTGVITLCYIIFTDNKKQSFLYKIRNTALHRPKCNGVS